MRRSHLSIASPSKRSLPERDRTDTSSEREAAEPLASTATGVPGRNPSEVMPSSRSESDPFVDALTEWTDGVIRDLDGATIALRALLDSMRRNLG